MRPSTTLGLAFLLSLGVLAAAPCAAEEKTKDLATDDGRLDPAWFGATAPDFHRCEGDRCKVGKDEVSFDYLWIKPGFSLKGHTLLLKPWEAADFRGDAKREANEIKNGAKITADAANELVKQLNKSFKGLATASLTEGDWIVTARVVDCAGPFGVGFLKFSNATYDLKINDKATGELLLALHTRHVGGKDVASDFCENVGKFLARMTDAEKLYAMGETIAAADARHKAEEAKEKKK
jgi:hypothetical protein